MAASFFRKSSIIFLVVYCTGCNSSAHMMTRTSFDQIQMGSSIDEITGKYGKPYSVKTLSDGSKQYVYIERYMIGDENVEEKRYYLIIKNGKVISKRYNQELPPAYDEIYDDDPNDVPN